MATEIVQYRTCLSSELDDRPIVKGSIIICSDTGDCYYDSLDGDRLPVSNQIIFIATESERTAMLAPESGRLYLVIESGRAYIYTTEWLLVSGTITYFYIHNCEIQPNDSTMVSDGRVLEGYSATFIPAAELADLCATSTFECECFDAGVLVTNDCAHIIYGTIEVVTDTRANIKT